MSKFQISENDYYDANFSLNKCIVEKSSHTDVNEYTTFLYVYVNDKITECYSRVIKGIGVYYYKEEF